MNSEIKKTDRVTSGNLPVYELWIDGESAFSFVRCKNIPEEDHATVAKWMGGQTVPVVDEETMESGIYVWDWEHWWRTGRVGKPISPAEWD